MIDGRAQFQFRELGDMPLFRGVSQECLDSLGITRRAFESGEMLIECGDPPKHVLIILSGSVDVQVNRIHLWTRQRPEILGEQAFINGEPHSATCIARGPVQVLCIPSEGIERLLSVPAFVSNLLCAISSKLRQSTNERYLRFGTEQLLFSEFRGHVSREVRNELLDHGEDYGYPRRVLDAVVLFSDIRSFSEMSRDTDPLELAEILSAHFGAMVKIIHDAGGLVDKFIGDAVMAVWGFPGLERPPNDRILDCAEQMVRAASERVVHGVPLTVGVGMNQGGCFMGNVGTSDKRQFTVLGETVNLAARFESQSKHLGDIVVGSSFRNGLSDDRRRQFSEHHSVPLHNSGEHTIFSLNMKGV